ncbi:MAG TPA: hypothetical protein VKE51_37340 [Vicinamibacterales bacterium]|nr:hypothetical protein [Vicinamibacterales bacterium]
MAETATQTSAGPESRTTGDVPVHIIFVEPTEAIGTVSSKGPSDQQLDEAAKQCATARPTDIVVFGGKPWHCVGKKLHEHPHVHDTHPETILTLSYDQKQKAVWWSERRFRITDIKPSPHFAQCPTPPGFEPAYRPFPVPSTEVEQSADDTTKLYVARSETPLGRAIGRYYKMEFTIEGAEKGIDPDMYCGF